MTAAPQRLTPLLTAAEFRGMAKPKRSKYGVAAKAERTYAGRLFASRLECSYAQLLDTWKLAGAVKEWWPQVVFDLHAPGGVRIGRHVIDFKVLHSNGEVWWVEVKGFDHPLGKWKRAHCMAEHGIKITVVKKIP